MKGQGGIQNPFDLQSSSSNKEFKGELFPSYFNVKKNRTVEDAKICNINKKFRIEIFTDAVNDYFERDESPGSYNLFIRADEQDQLVTDYSLHLWNGICNLSVKLPEKSQIGDLNHYIFEVYDEMKEDPFIVNFFVKVYPAHENNGHGHGDRKTQGGEGDNDDSVIKSEFLLPNIREVYHDKWNEHYFSKYSAIDIAESDGQTDLYVNMENIFLLSEIKNRANIEADVLKTQYKFAMALFSISYISLAKGEALEELPDYKIPSQAFSMIIIPTLHDLTNLVENE